MFTEKVQSIIQLAKDRAFALTRDQVDLESMLAAIGQDAEAGVRLAECLTKGDTAELRGRCPEIGAPAFCSQKLEPDEDLRAVLEMALDLASGEGVPDKLHPGLIALEHLACAVATSYRAVEFLGEGLSPLTREEAINLLSAWYSEAGKVMSLGELVGRLRGLRQELLSKVFGQDHAIHAVVEGLYNAQVTATADKERKRPEAVFVFAGPPGVGKTYLSEFCAARLERPFRRFDMTGYADHLAHNDLVGFSESYRGAQPGQLTGFVESNPTAILLFDEIEKAHNNTIQLFYQILDAGRLEDKYQKKDVSFRDTIIVFTTNAGRSLYDNPNRMGIGVANSTYHKRTILSALENEKNPSNGKPVFPPAICSRLGQGYPVMFNHLRVKDLQRIVGVEMARTESLLERQYFRGFRHDPRLPISLVFREGARVDARQLRSEAEKFVKTELFKFCSLYARERLEDVFEEIDEVYFSMDNALENADAEVRALYESPDKPRILLATGEHFAKLCRKKLPDFEWLETATPDEACERLAVEDVDFVLVDLWLRRPGLEHQSASLRNTQQESADYMALASGELDHGRRMLQKIHDRFPEMPVYLLSFKEPEPLSEEDRESSEDQLAYTTIAVDSGNAAPGREDFDEVPKRKPIDDELFLACVRAGGARGLVTTDFGTSSKPGETARDQFSNALSNLYLSLYTEKRAKELAREHKALSFDTISDLNRENKLLTICLRNFHFTRIMDASDAGEMMEDVMRPTTHFDDVLGATEAKKAMSFIVDWLRNPKRYNALGLRPPKGVLMTGPPGTGKTMLARAVAGESNCAFIEKTATSFVTVWQGSGPQNVRDLFTRARKYAPTIIFIDEIDAIGKERSAGPSSRAQEETLNALLTEMDGFGAGGAMDAPVIVLAATNIVDQLDEALKRRFDRVIEVDRPDRAARLAYLKKFFEKRKQADISEKTLERLAGQTAGMTIANLERIVQEAGVMAAQQGKSIDDALLEEAFDKIRMGEAKEAPEPVTLKRIARHEAGHTLIAWLGGNPPVQVTIVGRGGAGGFMEREADETRILHTKPEIEQLICEAMGGRAAELLFYGDEEGLSTGAGQDLKHATRWAVRMVREFGMDDSMGNLAIRELTDDRAGDGPLCARVARLAGQIVKEQLNRALKLLQKNWAGLEVLAAELLQKNRLTREDIQRILEEAKPDHTDQPGLKEKPITGRGEVRP